MKRRNENITGLIGGENKNQELFCHCSLKVKHSPSTLRTTLGPRPHISHLQCHSPFPIPSPSHAHWPATLFQIPDSFWFAPFTYQCKKKQKKKTKRNSKFTRCKIWSNCFKFWSQKYYMVAIRSPAFKSVFLLLCTIDIHGIKFSCCTYVDMDIHLYLRMT